MYKYGEKILVANSPKQKYFEVIFIHKGYNNTVHCVAEVGGEENFYNNEGFCTRKWYHHKPLSEKYDPAEMVGKIIKGKINNSYKIILEADKDYIYFLYDGCFIKYTYSMMERDYEVVE